MKKLYLMCLMVSGLILTSCSSYDNYKCKQSVIKEFPKAISIVQPVGEDYTFLVKDQDSSIYFVETKGMISTDVTRKELIFKK